MMHGPTFMGNPLACSVALASIYLLQEGNWQAHVKRIEEIMNNRLHAADAWPCVRDVRVLGAIGVIEVDEYINVGEFQRECVKEGVWIRPFGHNAYIMPPFMAVSDQQVEKLCDALLTIVDRLYNNHNTEEK